MVEYDNRDMADIDRALTARIECLQKALREEREKREKAEREVVRLREILDGPGL